MGTILSPSILACDHCDLYSGLHTVEDFGAKWVHVDVMDGMFVPSISFGQGVVRCLRKMSKLTLDVHLMVAYPYHLIESFADAGADILTVHFESNDDINETLRVIHDCGKMAGIAINPGTPVDAIMEHLNIVDLVIVMSVEPGKCGQKFISVSYDKISKLAEVRERDGHKYLISVDGGVCADVARSAVTSGADILVSGSSFFADKASYSWLV